MSHDSLSLPIVTELSYLPGIGVPNVIVYYHQI